MSILQTLKRMAKNESRLLKAALLVYNYFPGNNRIRMGGSRLELGAVRLRGCRFSVQGQDNLITIGSGSQLKNCHFHISGSHCRIHLDKFVSGSGAEFWIQQDGGVITVGEHTSFAGFTHLACTEGSTITIGGDCMFSANITLRTGDSHAILDLQGSRVNPARPITLGDHVWVGNGATLLKGVTLGSHCIVGTGSIVTKSFPDSHISIAGNPARLIKTGLTWDRELH